MRSRSDWPAQSAPSFARCGDGSTGLAAYVHGKSGLDLDDVYDGSNRTWSDLPRQSGAPDPPTGPEEGAILARSDGSCTWTIVNGSTAYRSHLAAKRTHRLEPADAYANGSRRMLISARRPPSTDRAIVGRHHLVRLWEHPQVRAELLEVLGILPELIDHVQSPVQLGDVPVADPRSLQPVRNPRILRIRLRRQDRGLAERRLRGEGGERRAVRVHARQEQRPFSPTTRYRDYAISRDLIHWESQSSTTPTVRPVCAIGTRSGRSQHHAVHAAPRRRPSVLVPRPSHPIGATSANARWRSRGDCITNSPATSSRSSQQPSHNSGAAFER